MNATYTDLIEGADADQRGKLDAVLEAPLDSDGRQAPVGKSRGVEGLMQTMRQQGRRR